MRAWKIITIPLIILVLAVTTACSASGNQLVRQYQQVQVVNGDLVTKLSGSGKIAVVNDAKLTFGSGGKLTTMNVAEGDNVTKGNALAKLDTSALELARAQAEVALAQAQVAVTQAQVNLDSAELNLKNTERLYVKTDDINAAQGLVSAARQIADYDQFQLWNAVLPKDIDYYTKKLADDNRSLTQAQARLDQLLAGPDTDQVAIAKSQVEVAQSQLENAPKLVEAAQKSLDVVQKQLDEATITAPFDGVVATIYAKVGDIIPTPTLSPQTIIYLVDVDNMEIDVSIDEIDIPSVQVGQKAVITVDALPGIRLDGTVASIATIPNAQAAAAGATAYVVKARFTIPQGIVVKAGMNASVDVVTNEHKNALLLPNDAIKKDNDGNSYVEIMNSQQIVTKPVVIGLSNSTETEIVSGLGLGDKVAIETTAGRWSLQSK